MPRVTLNLREAEKMEAVPDSIYLAEVFEVGETQEGPKANYIPVTLKVAEGEFEGRKLFVNLPIDGKGAGIFASFWEKATGEEIDWEDEELDLDTDDLIGAKVAVQTKAEEYPEDSGEFRSQVKKVMKAK